MLNPLLKFKEVTKYAVFLNKMGLFFYTSFKNSLSIYRDTKIQETNILIFLSLTFSEKYVSSNLRVNLLNFASLKLSFLSISSIFPDIVSLSELLEV